MSGRGGPPSAPRCTDEAAVFHHLAAGGWVDLLADAVADALASDPRLVEHAQARARDTNLFGLAPEGGAPNGYGESGGLPAEVSEIEFERVTHEIETALFAKAAEIVWEYIGPGGDHVLARVLDEVVAGAACEVEAGGRAPAEDDRAQLEGCRRMGEIGCGGKGERDADTDRGGEGGGKGRRGKGEAGGAGFGSPSSSSSLEGGIPSGGAGGQVAAP